MPGLCGRNCRIDGLQIPHFSNQYDLRCFPQSRAQRVQIILCIVIYLTLGYDAFLMGMQIFDWIFDRYDMYIAAFIDFINDAGERR